MKPDNTEYINFSDKDAIRDYFPSYNTPKDIIPPLTNKDLNEITIGPKGELTHSCEDTFTGPYISFEEINDPTNKTLCWDQYFSLDVKISSFMTGIPQMIINKLLNNVHDKLKITLYIDWEFYDEESDQLDEFIVDSFLDFFNNIQDVSKLICLEYKLESRDKPSIYIKGLRNLKTNIFSDIELWMLKGDTTKVWKWEKREKQMNSQTSHSKQNT